MSATHHPLSNRLGESSSRYLLQHAEDPLFWQPFGQDAFDLAQLLGRPLLISIGYSACHWCHVMAHETFNQPEVVAFLNEHFVAIKVDREEHPDVDALYMEALVAQQGSGGWPITVFATSTGIPLYCATYLPPFNSSHLPGLLPIARKIITLAAEKPETLVEASAQYRAVFSSQLGLRPEDGIELDPQQIINAMVGELEQRFDPEFGGFGNQPKFPQPYLLDILWRSQLLASNPERARQMVFTTLRAIASGGIHDHVDGGFFRYATDRFWVTPHFEKMLYDQAGLLSIFATVATDTGDEEFRWIAERIAAGTTQVLGLDSGLFASSADADSAGEEGGYYLLAAKELQELFGSAYERFAAFYGVTPGGNFEGRSILHRPTGAPARPPHDIATLLEQLSSYRRQRNELPIDDKATCDGNAGWALALMHAGRLLENQAMARAGLDLAALVQSSFRTGNDLSHVTYTSGEFLPGFAIDYVYYAAAMLEAATLTGDRRWSDEAQWALLRSLDQFRRDDTSELAIGRTGGPLPYQTYDRYDGATPATNALFAWIGYRVGLLTDNATLMDATRQLTRAYTPLIERVPGSFSILCWALIEQELGTTEVLIPGPADPELLATALTSTRSDLLVAHGSSSPLLKGLEPGRAYLCHNRVCQLPTTDPAALAKALKEAP